MIWGGEVSHDGTSAVGTAVAADAPPASEKDALTTPTTDKASFGCFRFEARFVCGMLRSSHAWWRMLDTLTLFVRVAPCKSR